MEVVGRAGGYFVVTIPWLFCNLRQYERDRQNYDPRRGCATSNRSFNPRLARNIHGGGSRFPAVRRVSGWSVLGTASENHPAGYAGTPRMKRLGEF